MRLAKQYPAPLHPTIVEPFAGSAQYAVHHIVNGHAERAVLTDTDPRVVEMWHRILRMPPAAVLALPPVVAGEKTSDPLVITAATTNAWGGLRNLTITPRLAKVWPTMLQNIAAVLPALKGRVFVA